jgi:hypothetical protein
MYIQQLTNVILLSTGNNMGIKKQIIILISGYTKVVIGYVFIQILNVFAVYLNVNNVVF